MEIINGLLQGFLYSAIGIGLAGGVFFLIILAVDSRLRHDVLKVAGILLVLSFLLVVATLAGNPSQNLPNLQQDQTSDLIVSVEVIRNGIVRIFQVALSVIVLCLVFVIIIRLARDVGEDLYETARKRYLNRVIRENEVFVSNTSLSTFHKIFADYQVGRMQIIGTIGMGKTTLLKQLLYEKAETALNDINAPIPVILEKLERKVGQKTAQYIVSQGTNPFLSWLIHKKANEGDVIFLIDNSDEKTMWGISVGVSEFEDEIYGYLERFPNSSFVLATSRELLSRLNPQSGYKRFKLEGLANEEIKIFLSELLKNNGDALYQSLCKLPAWLNLARRPFFLSQFVRFYKANHRLPHSLIELFYHNIYPSNIPPDVLNRVVFGIIQILDQTKELSLSMEEFYQIVGNSSQRLDAKVLCEQLCRTGLLYTFESKGQKQKFISFRHPLYYAFFTALIWHQKDIDFVEKQINRVSANPLLREAFVFLGQLKSKHDEQFTDFLEDLLERTDPMILRLAQECIVSLPPSNVNKGLLTKLFHIYVVQLASDDEKEAQVTWNNLKDWEQIQRIRLFSSVLAYSNTEAILLWLAKNAPDDLRALLFYGAEELFNVVADVMILHNKETALAAFRKLYHEVVDRHSMMLQVIDMCLSNNDAERRLYKEKDTLSLNRQMINASLSLNDVEDFFFRLYEKESTPTLREKSLIDFVQMGFEPVELLQKIIADPQENTVVVTQAAKLLLKMESVKICSWSVATDVAKALTDGSHLSDDAVNHLQRLLSRIEDVAPTMVAQIKLSFIPYVIDQPVTGKDFYGRERILRDIQDDLRNGRFLIIQGERRIGKSSLLLKLKELLLQENSDHEWKYISVYIDLHAAADSQDLSACDLFKKLISNILSQTPAAKEFIQEKYQQLVSYDEQSFKAALTEFLDHIQKKPEQRVRLVFLIDGMDEFRYSSQETLSQLDVFAKSDIKNNLSMVVASDIQSWTKNMPQAFLGLFEHSRVLLPLENQEARNLITQPYRTCVKFEQNAIERIIAVSACKPYKIQNICTEAVILALTQCQHLVTEHDVIKAIEGVQ